MNIIKTGEYYRIFDDGIRVGKELDAAAYEVVFIQNQGFFLKLARVPDARDIHVCREFLAECLPKAIQEADMVLSTKTPMTCSVDGDAAVMRKFFLLGAKDAPARLMAQSRAYPDDAEFQSPVFDDPVEFDRFGTSFYKLTVAIARDDEDVRIPLVAKKALFAVIPKKSDPIRGRIWVQGYLAGSDKV